MPAADALELLVGVVTGLIGACMHVCVRVLQCDQLTDSGVTRRLVHLTKLQVGR